MWNKFRKFVPKTLFEGNLFKKGKEIGGHKLN